MPPPVATPLLPTIIIIIIIISIGRHGLVRLSSMERPAVAALLVALVSIGYPVVRRLGVQIDIGSIGYTYVAVVMYAVVTSS